jgi:hypothetical protein
MEITDFPYRAIVDDQAREELHRKTELIRQQLNCVVNSCVIVGQTLADAQEGIRPELFCAWLFSELGWKPHVADALVDVATNYETHAAAFRPAAAIEMAMSMAVHSVCAAELVKARRLIDAYRAVVKQDGTLIHESRSGIRAAGRSRIRGRISRRTVRRESARPDSDQIE